MSIKAIFLDRDGVLNEEVNLLHKKEDLVVSPFVNESLTRLKEKGFLLICITNQPTVARGLISEEDVVELNNLLNKMIGNQIDRFYFCPHHPDANLKKYRKNCSCRKPSSGMILKAAKDYKITLPESWMIGDRISDIAAGKSAGCKTILIKKRYSQKSIVGMNEEEITPDFYVDNILQAQRIIIQSVR